MRLMAIVIPSLALVVTGFRPASIERNSVPTAANGVLTFVPALPKPGARVTATYTPMSGFIAEQALLLRGHYRVADADKIGGIRNVVIATLRRTARGVFTASFVFPDSAVYGRFAVEDSAGERVDANAGMLWELVARGPAGQPSYAGLIQSAHDHYGFWRDALNANALAMRLYPDSLEGWNLLRFHEHLALGTSGAAVDSALKFHTKNFAAFNARYANLHPVAPAIIAAMFDYARAIGDTAATAFWRARVLSEASGTRTAAQERGVATLMKWYKDKDANAALASYEQYWPEANGTHSQLPGWALQVAASTTDTTAIDLWAERFRVDAGVGVVNLSYWLSTVPARRAAALSMQEDALARLDANDPARRPLDQSIPQARRTRASDRARALGAIGRTLASMGRLDEAIDKLERASVRMMSPELFRTLGDLRLAKGDTSGAAREFAVVAADPGVPQGQADSLRARLGWSPTDPRWHLQLDSAGSRLLPLVLADTVDWMPPPTHVADDARAQHLLPSVVAGAPTVLVFWATNCGPCVAEIPELVRLTERFKQMGVKVISVTTDDVPSSRMREFMQDKKMNYAVYYDLLHEASNAFGVVGIPAVFILDGNGRVRFALSELAQVPRQIDALKH
jgi:thiol-disulfide isomerase/thioredoxin/tetratricopeptide (TPR) repeat protein